jgi:hypothetical protein
MFGMMGLISHLIPDESSDYQTQLQRSEFILSKLIDRVPDDEEDVNEEAKGGGEGGSVAEGGEEGQDEADIELGSTSAIFLHINPMLAAPSSEGAAASDDRESTPSTRDHPHET